MEFAKLREVHGFFPEAEDRSRPRIGTLIVSDDFDSSDGNLYPNHEVFGRSPKGEYPLFGQFDFGAGGPYLESVRADIPGVEYGGKGTYVYPFHLYGFDVPKFVGGTTFRKVRFEIALDPPFHLTGDVRRVGGYDPAWREVEA